MAFDRYASRIDGIEKVTGKAMYTADYYTDSMLTGKLLGSKYASARITAINIDKAEKLPGVVKVLTFRDAPSTPFSPRGNAHNLEFPAVRNMRLLTDTPRLVGDPIAAVIAIDEMTATRAVDLIEVEYQVLEPVVTIAAAMAPDAVQLHTDSPGNIMGDFDEYVIGDADAAVTNADVAVSAHYSTSPVQHCHIEPCCSYAYMDGAGRITIVSGNQCPFYARRRCAQALGIRESRIRIMKPYMGGGFGNRQDVVQEPLNAFLTLSVNGRPVKLQYTREETMNISHTRYGFEANVTLAADRDGTLKALQMDAYADGGAYAVHNHAIACTAIHFTRYLYEYGAMHTKPVTVYTNHASGGAMRGYGMPQGDFFVESAMDDLALELHMDPLAFRLKNLKKSGYTDPPSGVHVKSNGLEECLKKGAQAVKWERCRKEFSMTNSGNIRRGIGCAAFSFVCSTYPYQAEVSGCRVVLNEDGTFLLQIGATEIGQGSDTVFAQLAANTLGTSLADVVVNSIQDTDVSPFDGGAFATRQTYTCGNAVVTACEKLKAKILAYTRKIKALPQDTPLTLHNGAVYSGETEIASLEDVALISYFEKDKGHVLHSESSLLIREPVVSFGCTFAVVEVDINLCKVTIKSICNVHDSGKIINRQLAEAQVHGGMAMGIGAALYERMIFGSDGRLLNDNLLDYKLPTAMDIPDLQVDFEETFEPRGPYGAKGIGEPPAVSPAPAIRNAILNATGVHFNSLPISPQVMFEEFTKAGLIRHSCKQ